MHPHLVRKLSLRRISCTTLVAAAVGLAACAGEPSSPAPATVASPRAATGGAGATLAVTVLTSAGLPAPGLLVVPFSTATGPLQGGSYTSLFSDASGLATFTGLSAGDYCVTVRSLPSEALGFLGGIVPPPAGAAPTVNSFGPLAVMTGARAATVALTKANFTTYCTTSQAPISLKGGKTVKLTIALLDPARVPPGAVSWTLLGLTGAATDVPAWTVLDLPMPWFAGLGLPVDVRPGLLVATTAQGGSATGLNTTDEVVVQTSLFPGAAGQGLLTGTLHKVPRADGTATATIYAEPLVCVVDRGDLESFGDASGGTDLGGLGPNGNIVKMGWGAYQDLTLDPHTFSIWHTARGTTTVTLNLRFLGGPVAGISQDFDWNGTTWVKGATRGSGEGSVDVEPFATLLPDGSYRMTWVVSGLDAAVTGVDVQIKTTGDQSPDASRDTQAAGFYRLLEPSSSSDCTGGQGSDDRFWIG